MVAWNGSVIAQKDARMEHEVVIGTQARFCLLSDGVVRLEYAPDGAFEDRRSLRAVEAKQPKAFAERAEHGGIIELKSARFTIRYAPDGREFHAGNLQVFRPDGTRLWQPGQVDHHNLGGAHLAMDCIQRGIIPAGVHPAGDAHHDNSEKSHLWNYMFNDQVTQDPDAHYYGGMVSLEQLVAMKPLDQMAPHIQKLLVERAKYPPGILSRSGYFLYNDSATPVYGPDDWPAERPAGKQDWYLFVYGDDFTAALANYRRVFGASLVVPRYSLGLWFSRYPTFNQQGLLDLIDQFKAHDLPLDVMVLDLEWHQRGWFGFDWDRTHIPEPQQLLDHFHAEGIHCTLNLHPDGVPRDDSRFPEFLEKAELSDDANPEPGSVFKDIDLSRRQTARAFLEVFHQPVEQQGVDFWWIDGAGRTTHTTVGSQFWTNEIYQRHITQAFPDRRPLVFTRSAGFGSHRFPFHFTGDTYSQFEVLRSQVEYTLRAGHIGQSFVTHDIGGHMCKHRHIDSELLCRWYQFGAMSPIFRLHSSGGSERLPWLYGDRVVECLKAAMRFRMELLPYLYSLAWQSSEQCLPLCRSNALMQPGWQAGGDIWDSYWLGDRLYCAPILDAGGHRKVLLPRGIWYDGVTGEQISSDGLTPRFVLHEDNAAPLHYLKAKSIIPRQAYCHRAGLVPDTIILDYYPAPGPVQDAFGLYEDDGLSNDYQKGAFGLTTLAVSGEGRLTFSILPDAGAQRLAPAHRTWELHWHGADAVRVHVGNQALPAQTRTVKLGGKDHVVQVFDVTGAVRSGGRFMVD
jgi:alpha-glucosidase (family GH31 glycosyl hydrolase)